ncbi:hypothetical protein ACH5RR_032540 [Cinchona calisaya]|uniref:Uncharacterized protein n=1 Tax=Cinchona calisaya TaxID=153742 RepID=A0ABD2YJH6_9GENT
MEAKVLPRNSQTPIVVDAEPLTTFFSMSRRSTASFRYSLALVTHKSTRELITTEPGLSPDTEEVPQNQHLLTMMVTVAGVGPSSSHYLKGSHKNPTQRYIYSRGKRPHHGV